MPSEIFPQVNLSEYFQDIFQNKVKSNVTVSDSLFMCVSVSIQPRQTQIDMLYFLCT